MAVSLGGFSFKKTVTAAGTRERLKAAEFKVQYCKIKALAANTNPVFIGGADVASTIAEPLAASGVIELWSSDKSSIDLYKVYIDSTTNGEGVTITGVK